MQLQYDITTAEFAEAIKARGLGNRRRVISIFIDAFGTAMGVLVYSCGSHTEGLLFIFFFLTMAIASLFLLPSLIAIRWHRRNPRLFALRTVTLDEHALISDSQIAHTEIKWQNFERLDETKNLFLLYQSKDCVAIVPKRAVPGEATLAELRSLLYSKIPRNR